MVNELERLSPMEVEALMKAPLLVCILVAGADNEIDKKEIKGAIQLARKGKSKGRLQEFYGMVTEDFEDKFKILLQGLPAESKGRGALLVNELSQLNSILPKIHNAIAADYYKSLLYIARKIAESSGGLLGLKSVGEEELQLLKLSMIKDPALL